MVVAVTQRDVLRLHAELSGGERMTELVQGDAAQHREHQADARDNRLQRGAARVLQERQAHDEQDERPVQVKINAGQPAQPNRPTIHDHSKL
jgi:hypothetical protein